MLLNFKKLKVGHRLLGVIKQVNDYDLVISLPNHLTGFVSLDEVSASFASAFETAAEDEGKGMPSLKGVYSAGQMVVCSITAVQQKPKKRLELSLRASSVNSGLEGEADFVPGSILAAEVEAVEDRGYRVSFGVAGEFVGFLPVDEYPSKLSVGRTVAVCVRSVRSRLVQVSGRIESCPVLKNAPASALLRPGAIVSAEVAGHGEGHLRVKFSEGFDGRVDVFQLPEDAGRCRAKDFDLTERFPLGSKFRARLIWCDPSEKHFLLSGRGAIVQAGAEMPVASPAPLGSIIDECAVLRVDSAHGVVMGAADSAFPALFVHISQLTDDHMDKISGPFWKVDTRHAVRITDFDPFDGLLLGCTKPSVLKEAFVRMDEVQPGALVRGTVSRVEPYGLLVQLTEHIRGLCPREQLTETGSTEAPKKVAVGAKLRFRVLDVDATARRITLSRKAGLLASELPALCSLADARIGAHYDGYVAAIRDCGLVVRFYGGVKGLVPVAECSDEYQTRPQDGFFPGQVVRCRVIRCDAEAGELNLSLRKTTGPKEKPEGIAKPEKKKKASEIKIDDDLVAAPVAEETMPAAKKAKTAEKKSKEVIVEKEITLDDLVEDMPTPAAPTETVVPKKSSEPSVSGPSLRDICDEFEKRLIGQPNSSFLWIQYMSALLRASEPDAARSTAERALTTIRFRDVQEKLNVWIAYLNLERAVGTADSLKKVFERACVYNEPKHVHIQLAKIYEATSRPDDEEEDQALALHRVMCKKFSQSCKVWVGHMLYLYTAGKDETAARKLLPQALKSLPRRKHVKITCKGAQLEYKYGSAERARTLFEGVLANAPKRVDIWSVYLTMEENRLASDPENSDHVRRLFERIVHLRMSSKKAKFFFKRFLDFEKAHGSEESVEHVKELARTYVETNMAH